MHTYGINNCHRDIWWIICGSYLYNICIVNLIFSRALTLILLTWRIL